MVYPGDKRESPLEMTETRTSHRNGSGRHRIAEFFGNSASSDQSTSRSGGPSDEDQLGYDAKHSTQVQESGPFRTKPSALFEQHDIPDTILARYLSQLHSSPHDLTETPRPHTSPSVSPSTSPRPVRVSSPEPSWGISMSRSFNDSRLGPAGKKADGTRSQWSSRTADEFDAQDIGQKSAHNQGKRQGQNQTSHALTIPSAPRLQNDANSTPNHPKPSKGVARSQLPSSVSDARLPSIRKASENMDGVRQRESSSRSLQSKRPVTPSALGSSTPTKKAKRLPFDEDSSEEEDAAPKMTIFDKATLRPGQSVAQKLNLGRLNQMLSLKSKGHSGMTSTNRSHAEEGPPKANQRDSGIDSPFRKSGSSASTAPPSSAAKKHVSFATSVPEKRKAEEVELIVESSTRMARIPKGEVEVGRAYKSHSIAESLSGDSAYESSRDTWGRTFMFVPGSKSPQNATAVSRSPKPPAFDPSPVAKPQGVRQGKTPKSSTQSVGGATLPSRRPSPVSSTGAGSIEQADERHHTTNILAATNGIPHKPTSPSSLQGSLGITTGSALRNKASESQSASKGLPTEQTMRTLGGPSTVRSEQSRLHPSSSMTDDLLSSIGAARIRTVSSTAKTPTPTAPSIMSTGGTLKRGPPKAPSAGHSKACNGKPDLDNPGEMPRRHESIRKSITVKTQDAEADSGIHKVSKLDQSSASSQTQSARAKEAAALAKSPKTHEAIPSPSNGKATANVDAALSGKTGGIQSSPTATRKQVPPRGLSSGNRDSRPPNNTPNTNRMQNHRKSSTSGAATDVGTINDSEKPKTSVFKPPPPLSTDERRSRKLIAFEIAQQEAQRMLNKALGNANNGARAPSAPVVPSKRSIQHDAAGGGQVEKAAPHEDSLSRKPSTDKVPLGCVAGTGTRVVPGRAGRATASPIFAREGDRNSSDFQNGRSVKKASLDGATLVKPVDEVVSRKPSAPFSALLDEVADVATTSSKELRKHGSTVSTSKSTSISKDSTTKETKSLGILPRKPAAKSSAVQEPQRAPSTPKNEATSSPKQPNKLRGNAETFQSTIAPEGVVEGSAARQDSLFGGSVTASASSDGKENSFRAATPKEQTTHTIVSVQNTGNGQDASATASAGSDLAPQPTTSNGPRASASTCQSNTKTSEPSLDSPKTVPVVQNTTQSIERPSAYFNAGIRTKEASTETQKENAPQIVPACPPMSLAESKKLDRPASLVKRPSKAQLGGEKRVDSSTVVPTPGNAIPSLPIVRLNTPPALDAEPYFEFTVYEKLYSGSDSASTTTSNISGNLTSLEEANALATNRFTYMNTEDTKHKQIQFSEWTNRRDPHDCISYTGTFAPLDFPTQKSYYKVWVERQVVCGIAAAVQPPRRDTVFVGKTVYILRLFKLVDQPSASDSSGSASDSNNDDEDDDEKADTTSDAPTTDSEAEQLDPDFGKHAKKARAKQRRRSSSSSSSSASSSSSSSSSPEKPTHRSASKSSPSAARTLRIHHPIPHTSEIYTTLTHANRAARRLQIELSHEKEPSCPLTARWQEQNRRQLEERVCALEIGQGEEGQQRRFWSSVFNGVGRGGNRFELVVEETRLGGPRNV